MGLKSQYYVTPTCAITRGKFIIDTNLFFSQLLYVSFWAQGDCSVMWRYENKNEWGVEA